MTDSTPIAHLPVSIYAKTKRFGRKRSIGTLEVPVYSDGLGDGDLKLRVGTLPESSGSFPVTYHASHSPDVHAAGEEILKRRQAGLEKYVRGVE